eukprot:m.21525 g.21525  ORF g.21525 m.21525 type:complete len:848 (-) comp7175_c0_seq1:170-2713(-)
MIESTHSLKMSAFLAVFLIAQHVQAGIYEVYVDPAVGDDRNNASITSPLQTVYAARDKVRRLLREHRDENIDVHVRLMPGVHNVNKQPLEFTVEDSGKPGHPIHWTSHDKANPAVIGAPISVTGWKKSSKYPMAYEAQLPSNITKGTYLRQLWVKGQKADRPRIFGHGLQPGDNKKGNCLNLTNVSSTPMYPQGSAFDFSSENATDPSTWINPTDVEFVYTSCDAINCWIEPRCTVESVNGKVVKLKQDGNSSCFHRLYYYLQCFNNGQGGDKGPRGRNPTSLENVASNFTQPGQFYYDRAGATISYIPRAGETVADLEATATTATAQEILVANGTMNHNWDSVNFEYGTWLGASGNEGYVDTQSAYLCLDGEPPVNVAVVKGNNITFSGCSFQHLGAVYAFGADKGSQGVIVSNCTFMDNSGGGVKLGDVGERGAQAPNVTLDPSLQDRGFLVSDNLFTGIPNEYSGANPIFAGYVADTNIVHNTVHNSRYSGICAGWGWGMASYTRNIVIENNSITEPMQLLFDGGGVYTNTPCPNCHVSRNYFASDQAKYGCLYHDGGSALWNDTDNVFNHIQTPVVFAHGNCPGINVSPLYYNDSSPPNLQGATNNRLMDADGVCRGPMFVNISDGDPWPATAAEVVANAGRRAGPLPPLQAPPLSPPVNQTKDQMDTIPCPRFAARPCNPTNPAQQWILNPGVKPGDGQPTGVKSAVPENPSCWQSNNCGVGPSITCNEVDNNHDVPVKYPDGCKPLPNATIIQKDNCAHNQAFQFNSNGTIALVWQKTLPPKESFMHHCLQIDQNMVAELGDCLPPSAQTLYNQTFTTQSGPGNTIIIRQGDLCIQNNFKP